MSAFQMTCSCGHEIKVDAKNRDEAVKTIQGMMTKDAIAAHIKEKHPGDPVMPMAEVHKMIAMATAPA